jgi:anti-sigma regulatory factor (Ser/Thr protein kinase)
MKVLSLLPEIRAHEILPQAHRSAVTATVTPDSLGKVCSLVRMCARRTGLAPCDIEDLLIALSEVATNAIQYAGGAGSITMRIVAGGLIEIRDNGPGLPDTVTAGGPLVHIPDGGGLRRAQVLCEELHVLSGPLGVTVRMFMPCKTTE